MRIILTLSLSAATLSACGSSHGQVGVEDLSYVVNLARHSEQVVTLNNAEQEVTGQCMNHLGFKYFPVLLKVADVKPYLTQPEPGTLQNRRVAGYGFYGAIEKEKSLNGGFLGMVGQTLDSEDSYLRSLHGEFAARYDRALFGPPNDRISTRLVNGGTVSTGRDGCFASARVDLYGSIGGFVLAFNDVPLAAELISNDVVKTRIYSRALSEYRRCMSLQGFGVATPALARDEVQQRYKDSGISRANHVYEIAVASRDFVCGSISHLNLAFSLGLTELGGIASAKLQSEARTISRLERAALARARVLLATR